MNSLKTQLSKLVILVIGISTITSVLVAVPSRALDKSNEITSATASKIIASAYYKPFTLYKDVSIYKSIYNEYTSNGISTGNLQLRDDFSALLIDFVDYQIYSPYGQQVIRMESKNPQSTNDIYARLILEESNRARNWIDSLNCNLKAQIAGKIIPISDLKFDLENWQEEINRRESRNPILGGTGLGWSSSGSGGGYWSEEWFGNGIGIWLEQNYEEIADGGISYTIKIDRSILPVNVGNPGSDVIAISLNCTNSLDSKWKLTVSKNIKLNILPSKQIATIKVDYPKSVNLDEKAIAIDALSNSDSIIQIASSSPTICVAIGTGVVLKKTGICKLRIFQTGNEEFASAQTVVEFEINTSIVCIKGKLTKKVTAVKPVCPAGYKKK